ncbi:MAG: DUF4230 domain-containing protein [Akkermansiaceae bacterium]
MSDSPPLQKKPSRVLSFFIGLSLLLAVGAGALYFLVARPAMQAMSPVARLVEALENITDHEVSVNGSSITLARAEMRELAVVERRVQSMVKYETKWLGSDKMIIVKGDFLVKAGFDLTEFEGFELEGERVVGQWPDAKVLSVEQLDYDIFFSKNGVVNKLSENDYEAVSNLLQKQAREDAELRSDILESAERVIRTRLDDLSGGLYEWEPK